MKNLLAATALSCAAFALPAQALDLNAMTEAEREAFGAQVRAYLMENPQVILEAVNQMEQQQADQQDAEDRALVQANLEEITNDGFSWVGGNPDGDVTVVEFLDYRCGYCRKAQSEVSELLATDGNIRMVIKEFPILGEASDQSSRFAIAVRQIAGDAAYADIHDTLMAFNGDITPAALTRIAETFDLDAAPILDRMDSDEVTAEIDATRQLAQRLKIRGTPTFVMGGQMVRGYVPLDGLRQIIEEERG